MKTATNNFIIVEDNNELKKLNNAGLITWPVLTNNSKGIKFKYVNEVDSVGMNFEYKGNKYQLRYHDGCFYPFVYILKLFVITK